MGKICLDKTINESLKILKNEEQTPDVMEVSKFFGLMCGFSFKNSNKNQLIPIEHIGLAKLCYEQAVNMFYTTKINQDGSTEKVFEKLPEGSYVSDCLKNFSNDALHWYKDSSGEEIKLTKLPECIVCKPDLTKCEKFFEPNSQNQNASRLDAVEEAVSQAISLYSSQLLSQGEVSSSEELFKIKEEESNKLDLNLKELYSNQTLPVNEIENNEDISQ